MTTPKKTSAALRLYPWNARPLLRARAFVAANTKTPVVG